mgnify:CR=1 FL=1
MTIKLATLTPNNLTSMNDFSLPWSENSSTYTGIGTTSEGILTDAAYMADSNTIRTQRFMPMRVNLEREIEANSNRVRIILRYQWAIPDRRAADGSLMYHSGELRTVRSTALRF